MDTDYTKMLDRLYERLGNRRSSGNRFEIPEPEIIYQGSVTIWKNFNRFVEVFRRDREFMIKFFKKELGAPIEDHNDYVLIHRKIQLQILKTKINSFVELYIRCHECKGFDTHIQDGKILVCEICGASRVIK